jgi:small ligand-binding sensory domain FIST
MPFAAALSTNSSTAQALDEVCTSAGQQLSRSPDLAIAFFSPHHGGQAEVIARTLTDRLKPRCLLGCIGESIVGGGQEIEQRPALSLWLAAFPSGVELEPFHLMLEQTPDGPSLLGWPDGLLGADASKSSLLVLGDPFTFPVDLLLHQANVEYQGLRVMGGMASGIRAPGECRLLHGDRVVSAGAVGVLLQGEAGLRTIVSQGCRPIGRHLVITGGKENIITELGGKTPLAQLQELWQTLPPRDQNLMQRALHIGLVMNEYREGFQRGDFLVRNIYGLDQESGALVIADRIRIGQTVQFHVRDAAAADEDLQALVQQDLAASARPAGALLFTCNGRGTRLFDAPNHDAGVLQQHAGAIPLAGFFAQGELGPVGGQNFIHGFTASVVLFAE